jgi:hypothetical protein
MGSAEIISGELTKPAARFYFGSITEEGGGPNYMIDSCKPREVADC